MSTRASITQSCGGDVCSTRRSFDWRRSFVWRRSFSWLVVGAGISAVHFERSNGIVGQGTYLLITLGAAPAAWIGAQHRPAQWRLPWVCVAVGLTSSGIGDLLYYLLGWVDGKLPDVSVADSFWLASYVAIAVGLSSLIVGGYGARRIDVDGLIDIGSFAVLAVILATQISAVRAIVDNASLPISTRVIWTAYPILDAALLGVVVQAMFSRRLRGRSGVLLIVGVALWLVSDFTSLMIADASVVSEGADVGWMVGAVSLAIAAWPANVAGPNREPAFAKPRVTDARLVITLMPLVVPGVIEVWESSDGYRPNPVGMLAGTFLLVVLAFARSTRLVKARQRQEEALTRSTRFYAALAENSSDAVIVVDNAGRILNDAPNLAVMLGRAGAATRGMDVIELIRPRDRDAARSVLARWWSTSGVVDESEVRATEYNGSERWFGVRAANLSDDPAVGGMVINLRDITDRKRVERELSHSAFHDSLTGLANRALFHDRLEQALLRTSRTGMGVAVVFLDLDGFKTINDVGGHDAGDEVLREVASRLSSAVRTLDTVSRLGGDEFAILIEEAPRARDEAELVADRVLQSLTAPFSAGSQHIVLSASIGIAVGDIADTASSMIRNADMAMYKAKNTGKAKWTSYEPAMATETLDRIALENDLRQALELQQFRLVYQPVIDLQANEVVGFEALLRWDHPTRGVINPVTFVSIAESNGSIVAIGRWVLEAACGTAANWQHSYPHAQLTMAVNLSARQIATPDIVEHVAAALDKSGFPAALLILEMTESVLVQDAELAARRLHELRALGVRLAIDDFGTGYSSLSYLRQFPIDILKIDKSFTDTITDRSNLPPIVRGMLDLAKTMDMQTVAEGIEHDIQADSLRDQQCEFGQGFLFAEPLSIEEAAALLARSPATEPTVRGRHR